MVEIFTDGSSLGNPGPSGWGLVVVDNDRVIKRQAASKKVSTNNEMELTAILYALRYVAQGSQEGQVVIHTDSSYSLRAITEWSVNWEKNGWVNSKKQPVANKEIIKQSMNLYRQLGSKVRLQKIKAHAGHKYNEMADRLAVEFAEKVK